MSASRRTDVEVVLYACREPHPPAQPGQARVAWDGGTEFAAVAADQFRLLSTMARCLIHGIMARSLAPTSSIGCAAFLARIALKEVWLTRFSSIQSRVNLPDWMSPRIFFISALVSGVTTRGPETYWPYSAVLETE